MEGFFEGGSPGCGNAVAGQSLAHQHGLLGRRRIREELVHGQFHREALVEAAHGLDRQQRVSAQSEEVIVNADPLGAQDLGPRFRDHLFHGRTRRLELRRSAMGLAVRGDAVAARAAAGWRSSLKHSARRSL